MVAISKAPVNLNNGNTPTLAQMQAGNYAYFDKQDQNIDNLQIGAYSGTDLSISPSNNINCGGASICLFNVTNLTAGAYIDNNLSYTVTVGGQTATAKAPVEFSELFTVYNWNKELKHDQDFTVNINKGDTTRGYNVDDAAYKATHIVITSINGGSFTGASQPALNQNLLAHCWKLFIRHHSKSYARIRE